MIDLDTLEAAIAEGEKKNFFVAPIVKELIAELRYLRGERAAVVAWLRERANAEHPIERGIPSLSPAGRGLLLLHADCIERGEHRREEET